jgi:hypothetical protein
MLPSVDHKHSQISDKYYHSSMLPSVDQHVMVIVDRQYAHRSEWISQTNAFKIGKILQCKSPLKEMRVAPTNLVGSRASLNCFAVITPRGQHNRKGLSPRVAALSCFLLRVRLQDTCEIRAQRMLSCCTVFISFLCPCDMYVQLVL